MTVNGYITAPTLAILLPEDKPALLDDVALRLAKLPEYRLQTMVQTDMMEQLDLDCIDALITVCTPNALKMLAKLKADGDYTTRPMILLLGEGEVDPHFFTVADMILPSHSVHFEQQLHALLRMRADNIALQREIAGKSSKIHTLEEELRSQKRGKAELALLKNAIVRNVSHELKTPLLHVKSAVALLAEDVGKDHKLISYAEDATARLEALVKNITQLATGLDITLSPVIVSESVDQALRNLRRKWEHRDQIGRIQNRQAAKLPLVFADRQGLGTVLQLLLDNALKFSEKDVEVIIEQREDKIYFAVRDYGIGIAKDQMDAIFELFYQVDSSSTRRYGGTGVGLAIVRLILDRHNVTINVESIEGKGSTFSFMLPVADLN